MAHPTDAHGPTLPSLPRLPPAVSPAVVADLMLAAATASVVRLAPEGETSVLMVERSDGEAAVALPGDVGCAAVVRLAALVGLDPLIDGRAPEARSNVVRLEVRLDDETVEVLVGLEASPNGLVAELRPLLRARPPAPRSRHVALKRCAACGIYQPPQRDRCAEDGGALVEIHDDPAPDGTVGVYRIARVLGEGGTGRVFEGVHALIGRPVAVKVMHRELSTEPHLGSRFLREARALSRLAHPNVVSVTDFGLLDDGRPYLVMERLAGESLEDRIEREGALEPLLALRIAGCIAAALDAAHAAGIVHNDLKPSNVVLTGVAGSTPAEASPLGVKLLDFGAAAWLGAPEEPYQGTPSYTAPERILGLAADERSDIYSLGVVLYDMLSGAPPFDGEVAEVLEAHVSRPPPPLVGPRGVLPRAVERLVGRALAKDPDARPQSAREVAAELERAVEATASADWKRWMP
jgi:serine/threonine-protein kinase